MSVDPHQIVTFIITHKIRVGKEAEYEVWVKEIGDACQQYEGHLGSKYYSTIKYTQYLHGHRLV